MMWGVSEWSFFYKRGGVCLLHVDLNVDCLTVHSGFTFGNEAEWVAFALYVNLLYSCLVMKYFEYLLNNLTNYIIY